MKKYIPYSIRHNITDPNLAWLLDYLERVMGWDIREASICDSLMRSYDVWPHILSLWDDGEIQFLYEKLDLRIPEALFFRTYKTLIPAIRDLYSK